MIRQGIMLPLSAKGTKVLINKLDLNKVNNITYTKVTEPVEKIVAEIKSSLKNKFNLEVSQIYKKLSNIYWTPKLLNSIFLVFDCFLNFFESRHFYFLCVILIKLNGEQ